jgi:hypothetical protein
MKGFGGPRTERGKDKSRRNAIKLGIFSTLAIPIESQRAYRHLSRALLDYIKPENCVERVLVEKLAANLWRQGRLIRAEGAEMLNMFERAIMELILDPLRPAINRERNGGLLECGADSNSLKRGIELLRELQAHIEERGFDFKEDFTILYKCFGPPVDDNLPDDMVGTYVQWLNAAKSYVETKSKVGIPLEEAKQHAVEAIDMRIKWAERQRPTLERFESVVPLTRMTSLYPSDAMLEKIIRYESHLGREFDRTLQQIERLRRIRAGQRTAPPIEVKLST